MRLSFSTNGWDDFDWSDFYVTAKDLQFSGIEIHDIKREVFSGSFRKKAIFGLNFLREPDEKSGTLMTKT